VLWEGNPQAIEGEMRARRAWANAALNSGDLGLARSQLEGLNDDESRALSQSIDAAHRLEAKKQRHVTQLRILVASGLGVILLGLAVGLLMINKERSRVAASAKETGLALQEARLNQERADGEAARATAFAKQVEEEAKAKIEATEARAREEARANLNEDRARELAKEALASAARADAEAAEAKSMATKFEKAAALARIAEAEAKDIAVKLEKEASEREAALKDIQVYADAYRATELEARANSLLSKKEEASQELQSWLFEAAELSSRRRQHEDYLLNWESDRSSKETQNQFGELAKERRRKRDAQRKLSEDPSAKERSNLQRSIDASDEIIARLKTALKDPALYSYKSDREQSQHQVMTSLVDQLAEWEETGGLLSRVRVKYATEVEAQHRKAQDPKLWTQIRAAIRRTQAYGGIQIQDWQDLYPLGQDPQSGLFEFLHLGSHRGVLPERNRDGILRPTPDMGIVFVLIPGGTAMIGAQKLDSKAPQYDDQATEREGPVCKVPLDPYLIARHELSRGQWQRLTGGALELSAEDSLLPVTDVSYEQLEGLTSVGLLLPTEVQWEHAARGGLLAPWSTPRGKSGLVDFANLRDRSSPNENDPSTQHENWNDHFPELAPIGKLEPNPFGLQDVLGNVSEWCRDGSGSYGTKFARGSGLRESTESRRVLRGGNYKSLSSEARVSARAFKEPNTSSDDLGARLSMIAELR
jgi:formylglycine-generating enzyme required for sulfatase activity